MSKSQKNTIDPEEMIKKYGADSVRWFILSLSPKIYNGQIAGSFQLLNFYKNLEFKSNCN